MSLANLVAFAAVNNNTRKTGGVPKYELSIEDARKACVIQDGNKKANEDGSQALTVVLGRVTLVLNAIAKNVTRVNATADQVAEFTASLQAAIDDGSFDADIAEAQHRLNPANRPAPKAKVVAVEGEAVAPAEVDLSALDDVSLEEVDVDNLG